MADGNLWKRTVFETIGKELPSTGLKFHLYSDKPERFHQNEEVQSRSFENQFFCRQQSEHWVALVVAHSPSAICKTWPNISN